MPGPTLNVVRECPIRPKSAIVGGPSNACVMDQCAWWVQINVNGQKSASCAVAFLALAMMNSDFSLRAIAAATAPTVPADPKPPPAA